MHDRVMVAVDPRSPNHQAIDEAAVLARSHQAELLIVVPYPTRQTHSEKSSYDATPYDQQWQISAGSHAEDMAGEAVLRARHFSGPSVRIHTRCEPGAPVPAIRELVDTFRPDLLVVGPSAHRSGSAFTHRVIRTLERRLGCEVMVVDAKRPLPADAPALAPGLETRPA